MLNPLMLEDRPHWETTFPDDVWGAYTDFRNFLREIGLDQGLIGDIWTLGDRGAQGIIATNNENLFSQISYFLRDVEVKVKITELKELKTS